MITKLCEVLSILIALMQVVLPLSFIVFSSIKQDLYAMKQMAVLIIVIEALSILFLIFQTKLITLIDCKYDN